MNIRSAQLVYFSPTGTTRKVGEAIIDGLGLSIKPEINITKFKTRTLSDIKTEADLIIIGFPVYAEHIPSFVEEFLERLNISGHYAIGYSVYGNMDYGMSLKDIYRILKRKDQKVIGLGTFLAEHTFSTQEAPLAEGRPDKKDIDEAKEFGIAVKQKIDNETNTECIESEKVPGHLLMMAKILPNSAARLFAKKPIVNGNCIHCGACVRICPMDAIAEDLNIVEDKCIRCFACVKVCKFKARNKNFNLSYLVKKLFRMKNRIRKSNMVII